MTHTLDHDRRTARRSHRTAGWTTVAGLAVLAGAAVTAYSWRGDLPDRVATHWGIDGTADRFGSLNAALGGLLGVGAVLVLVFGAVTAFLGHSATTRRMGAATTIWAALFTSVLLLGTLHVQRGLAVAHSDVDVSGVILLAIVASLLPAVAVGLLVPGDPRQPAVGPVSAEAPRERLSPQEQAAWIGRTEAGPGIAVGIVVVAVTIGLVLFTRMWGMLVVPALLLVSMAAMFSFVVRVDRTGLAVHSALGWPRTRVPLDEVVRADVIQVRPLREFGGWGWRVGRGGRVGIVLRAGAALLVERTGGRSLVVTVPDARTAAGLLNALADRERQAPGPEAGSAAG